MFLFDWIHLSLNVLRSINNNIVLTMMTLVIEHLTRTSTLQRWDHKQIFMRSTSKFWKKSGVVVWSKILFPSISTKTMYGTRSRTFITTTVISNGTIYIFHQFIRTPYGILWGFPCRLPHVKHVLYTTRKKKALYKYRHFTNVHFPSSRPCRPCCIGFTINLYA